jgi:single-strand DNA-binding protein
MVMSVNKVILLGNVGRDPEIRELPNGGRVANFSIATEERWRDKQTGEQRERTEWHRIVVFNPMLIDIVDDRVFKGTRVYIEGQLQTRRWQDPSGYDRFTTEIALQRFGSRIIVLNDRRYDEGHDDAGTGRGRGTYPARVQADHSQDADYDEEVPF